MKPYSWIKLSTDFFDDPKVLRLQTYPEKDFLLIFWIKIVLLSLRRNDGLLLIDDTLPYSVSDFVVMFRKEENVIRMALSIFEKLNMIVVKTSAAGEIIGIREFVGFTDVEGLEDARKKNREKQAAFRKRQRESLIAIETNRNEEPLGEFEDVTGYGTVTNQNFEVSNQKVTEQNKNRIDKEENRVEEEKDFARNDFSKSEKSVSEPNPSPSSPEDSTASKMSKDLSPHQRIGLNLKTFHWQGILPEDIDRWKETFPAVDVEQELREMELWAAANPAKRKSNWFRFITNWLSREQERGGFALTKQLRRTENGRTPKTFEQIKAERTHAAAKQVLDEMYGPENKEDSSGTITI